MYFADWSPTIITNFCFSCFRSQCMPKNDGTSTVVKVVQRDRNLWSCDHRKGYSPEDQHFLSIFPNETAAYFVISAPPI